MSKQEKAQWMLLFLMVLCLVAGQYLFVMMFAAAQFIIYGLGGDS